MKRLSAFARLFPALLAAGLVLPAQAAELPPFLSAGQVWSTDERACGNPEEGIVEVFFTASAEGVFGYEFGCNFASFMPVRSADGEVYSWVAVAACGDDSGITRPDLFAFTQYEDVLTVTSQNDFQWSTGREQTEEEAQWSLVNREFALCK